MQSLSRSSTIVRVVSALPRWWLPLRDAAVLMAPVSAHPNKRLDHVPRAKDQTWARLCFSSGSTQAMDEAETKEEAADDEDAEVYEEPIIRGSSHRDGAIYSNETRYGLRTIYGFDISDRTETQLEDPTCGDGLQSAMMQIFSLKLARTPTGSGPAVQLYGYVAARDEVDGKLNYIFNRGRDDPITVRRGSLIEMTGPKKPIVLFSDVLLEFDVRIRRDGDRDEEQDDDDDDDVQLIDGASFFAGLHMPCRPRKARLGGGGDRGGAVDMSFASVDPAVHAIVDVVVSDVQVAGFELSLGSVLSFEEIQGGILLEEFQLFRGTVVGDEPCALRRFVVAVTWDTVMQLKFKIATTSKGCSGNDVEHSCSFEAQLKGEASHQINLEIASILVKVTWATLSL